jgi:DNA repair exonuclease SbcCD ATPase subunit
MLKMLKEETAGSGLQPKHVERVVGWWVEKVPDIVAVTDESFEAEEFKAQIELMKACDEEEREAKLLQELPARPEPPTGLDLSAIEEEAESEIPKRSPEAQSSPSGLGQVIEAALDKVQAMETTWKEVQAKQRKKRKRLKKQYEKLKDDHQKLEDRCEKLEDTCERLDQELSSLRELFQKLVPQGQGEEDRKPGSKQRSGQPGKNRGKRQKKE